MGGFLHEVAVAPDVRVFLEVGGAVLLPVRIVPEADRHRGKGLDADQLTLGLAHRMARLVEHLDRHAEAAALYLPAPHRADRVAEDEAGNDVGAAGDGGELHVALDVLVHVAESLRHQRTAGGKDGAQLLQVVGPDRRQVDLGDGVDELGRGA